VQFDLLYANTAWQIFAAWDIPVTIDYIDPNPDDEKYTETLSYMTENSYVDFGVDVPAQDRILILSTCTSNENIRFVVAAKLVQQISTTYCYKPKKHNAHGIFHGRYALIWMYLFKGHIKI